MQGRWVCCYWWLHRFNQEIIRFGNPLQVWNGGDYWRQRPVFSKIGHAWFFIVSGTISLLAMVGIPRYYWYKAIRIANKMPLNNWSNRQSISLAFSVAPAIIYFFVDQHQDFSQASCTPWDKSGAVSKTHLNVFDLIYTFLVVGIMWILLPLIHRNRDPILSLC